MPQELVQLKWYHFGQNNSGGTFVHDSTAGIGHRVLVQATSHHEANRKAQDIGLYFHGIGDCECCGNRWHEQWDADEGTVEPMVYDEVMEPCTEAIALQNLGKWDWGIPSYMHFFDGTFSACKRKIVTIEA